MTTPPSAPGAPAVKSTAEYFNSSRLKVIGMITAATVAVGALGGIAGVAFDPDPAAPEVVQPGPDQGAEAGGGGQARLLLANPMDVAGGDFVTLANGVEIFVPDGWSVYHQDDANINLTNGEGAYAYSSGGFEPSASAASVILDSIDGILPPDNYTQRQVSEVFKWSDPYGTVGETVGVEYQAMWVDDQGSALIYGQIYAGVRQDGTALVYLIENIPPEGFNAAYEDVPMAGNTFARFGGIA